MIWPTKVLSEASLGESSLLPTLRANSFCADLNIRWNHPNATLPTAEPKTIVLSIPGNLLKREESWVAMPSKIPQDGRSKMRGCSTSGSSASPSQALLALLTPVYDLYWLLRLRFVGSTGFSGSSLSPFLASLAPPCQHFLRFWLMFVTSTGSFGPSFSAFPALLVPRCYLYRLFWLLCLGFTGSSGFSLEPLLAFLTPLYRLFQLFWLLFVTSPVFSGSFS